MAAHSVIDIKGLTTAFEISGRDIAAVRDVDLRIAEGETLALVGESGSGKPVTSLSIMGLLPKKFSRIAIATGRRARWRPARWVGTASAFSTRTGRSYSADLKPIEQAFAKCRSSEHLAQLAA